MSRNPKASRAKTIHPRFIDCFKIWERNLFWSRWILFYIVLFSVTQRRRKQPFFEIRDYRSQLRPFYGASSCFSHKDILKMLFPILMLRNIVWMNEALKSNFATQHPSIIVIWSIPYSKILGNYFYKPWCCNWKAFWQSRARCDLLAYVVWM